MGQRPTVQISDLYAPKMRDFFTSNVKDIINKPVEHLWAPS